VTSLTRRVFCACVLILVAAGVRAGPAFSQQTNASSPPVRLAMAVAPLNNEALVPRLVEPAALLCGNVWVNTAYVLPNNCLKACLHNGHSLADCKTTLVPICEACWKKLQTCATAPWIPPALRCKECTAYYAQCMKPFF
jgi:hypothetical protein